MQFIYMDEEKTWASIFFFFFHITFFVSKITTCNNFNWFELVEECSMRVTRDVKTAEVNFREEEGIRRLEELREVGDIMLS